jgi:hypothetical protein
VSAVTALATGWDKIGTNTELPPGAELPLLASQQAGKGQALFFDATGATNYVGLNDGTVPGQICAGVAEDELSPQVVTTVAGAKGIRLWTGQGAGQASAPSAGDALAVTDVLVPVFDAGNGVPGKLSNGTSSNGVTNADRSFLGLGLGWDPFTLTPRILAGRVGSLLGRLLHSITGDNAGLWAYAADASATTDQGSLSGSALSVIGFVLPRAKRRMIVTSVEIIPSATLAAAGTNYRTITLWKVDTTGTVAPSLAPVVATFVTSTQGLTAGQPTAFTLGASSALLLRETDILVGTSIHTASGATIPTSAIRANAKVI